ncbi:hypothetical protein PRIPAC_76803 [Pristionchus pacificus]|uniref:LEM domain-containing protein n=1 Tax=Pristionchus pacificus TaxID=54126 RepID=A0A2A6CB34_PRIPA|nr:hypothetical protein PRIPAC_76803 [Pristionchus pacificus]|eukprot:PDM75253.1 hypothetical protein PRIPAC_43447 [Pristionchus pacificus]
MARTRANATEAERRSVARKANHSKKKYNDGTEPDKTTVDTMDMSDRQLLNALRALGATVGPVNDGTRAVYQRRLGKLMKEKGLTNIDELEHEVEQEEPKNRKGKKNENVKQKTTSQKKKEKIELNDVMEENEDEIEEDEKVKEPIEIKIDKLKIDETQKGRKTRSKKVSFAQMDEKEKKTKDKDENDKTEEIPVQVKKRDPSVQIVDVRKNEIKDKRKEIRRTGLINRTIVIEEDEEEDWEKETSVVRKSTMIFDRQEVRESYLAPNDGEEEENERVVVDDVKDEEEEGEGERETTAVENSTVIFERQEIVEREEIDEVRGTFIILRDGEEEEHEIVEDDEEEEGEREIRGVEKSTVRFASEEVGDNYPIPSDREEEDENEREMEYGEEEDEMGEDSPQHLPMKSRPRFSVESHAESILRRSQLNRDMSWSEEDDDEKEEDDDDEYDDRRKTIDIFNRKSHHTLIEERKSAQPLARKMSLIIEESVDMDVSPGSVEMKTMTEQARENYMMISPPNDSDEMDISNDDESSLRMFRGLSRRLYIDDSVHMDVSNRSRDDTLKLRQIDKNASILIVDTPKSSRMSIKKNDTSLYGPRNIRKMIGKGEEKEDTFRIPQNRRLTEDLMYDSPDTFPILEDTFMNYRRGHLEHSVGIDTFNNGISHEGRNRMNSTRNSEAIALMELGKTFTVKEVENEKDNRLDNDTFEISRNQEERVNNDTFVVSRNQEKMFINDATFNIPRRNENTIREREKSTRLTLNIVRSPSRSPIRNRTYVLSHSPSRINSTRKSSIGSTPTRSRPPKPMPRRIKPEIECDGLCTSSSIAPSQLKPPIPAPRRIPPSVIGETRKSRFDGRNMVNEKNGYGISPASLFNTQPRLGERKAQIESESTPIDRENITKLKSLREQMSQKKKEGQPVFELDTEARLIIEDAPHLKLFFY